MFQAVSMLLVSTTSTLSHHLHGRIAAVIVYACCYVHVTHRPLCGEAITHVHVRLMCTWGGLACVLAASGTLVLHLFA